MQEFPPPPKPEPNPEEEINPEKKQEELSVSEIIEKIENGENVSEEDERKLREGIEEVVLEDKPEGEWTAEENEMRAAYSRGVNEGLFPESEKISLTLSFDLESVRYNGFNREEKEKTVEKRVNDAKEGLAEMEEKIIMDEYRDLKKREDKRMELKDEKDRINDEKMEIYEKFYREEINTEDILSEKGKEDLIEIINALKESNQAVLNMNRFEYCSLADDDIESLIKESHIENDFEIRKLEKLLASYNGSIDILSKKELTPEQEGALAKFRQLIKENPRATRAVIITAALLIIGAIAYPYVASYLAERGMEEVGEKMIEKAIEDGVAAETAKKIGLAGIGAAVGGAGLLGAALYKLSQIKEEDVDDFMSKICGVAIPHRKTTTTATK